MNLNMIISCRIKYILFIFLVCSVLPATGQSKNNTHIDYVKLQADLLRKYLNPVIRNKSDTVELFAFRVRPEINPNSSFRLLKIKTNFYLEARYLNKNIWTEMFSSIKEHKTINLNISIDIQAVQVSEKFKNLIAQKFEQAINRIIKIRDHADRTIYDGTYYDFCAAPKEQIATIAESNLNSYDKASSYVRPDNSLSNIIQGYLQMLSDIKSNNFNENSYFKPN